MSPLQPDRPPLSHHRLAQLLDRWAVARRLDAPRADAARERILAAPVDLGFDWWWRLLDPEHGTVFQRTLPQIAPFDASGLFAEAPDFRAGMGEPAAWPQDDGDYQPYLRL